MNTHNLSNVQPQSSNVDHIQPFSGYCYCSQQIPTHILHYRGLCESCGQTHNLEMPIYVPPNSYGCMVTTQEQSHSPITSKKK